MTGRSFYQTVALLDHLSAFFEQSQSLHTARFARLHEQSSLLTSTFDETSLLVGTTHFFNQVLSVRPTKTRWELGNMVVVAPPRSGKSVLATAQLLSFPHSVIVNDVKGELFQATAGYRATLGKVYVLDPQGYGNCYDPLTGKQTEDELLSLATQLLYQPDERDKIFTERAIVMFTQLLLAARIEGYPPLPYVRYMVRLGLPDVAARLQSIDPELATQFLDVPYEKVNYTDRFLLDSWGTLTARLRPLLTETVVKSLAGADFNVTQLMTSAKPITVYLRWKEQDLLALAPLVRLLWTSLIDGLITTYDSKGGQGCHPVLLLIDEAGRTAIPSLADHATTVVGRGISLWIAIQDLNQLDAVYGRERARVLRNNCDSAIYYRPNDLETAEYIERRLGRKSDYAESKTSRDGKELSQGQSEQGVPLLTARSIMELADEEIIGFHRHLPPLRLKRLDWRNYPLLVQRRKLPAPPLTNLPSLTELPLHRTTSDPTHGFINPDSLE